MECVKHADVLKPACAVVDELLRVLCDNGKDETDQRLVHTSSRLTEHYSIILPSNLYHACCPRWVGPTTLSTVESLLGSILCYGVYIYTVHSRKIMYSKLRFHHRWFHSICLSQAIYSSK